MSLDPKNLTPNGAERMSFALFEKLQPIAATAQPVAEAAIMTAVTAVVGAAATAAFAAIVPVLGVAVALVKEALSAQTHAGLHSDWCDKAPTFDDPEGIDMHACDFLGSPNPNDNLRKLVGTYGPLPESGRGGPLLFAAYDCPDFAGLHSYIKVPALEQSVMRSAGAMRRYIMGKTRRGDGGNSILPAYLQLILSTGMNWRYRQALAIYVMAREGEALKVKKYNGGTLTSQNGLWPAKHFIEHGFDRSDETFDCLMVSPKASEDFGAMLTAYARVRSSPYSDDHNEAFLLGANVIRKLVISPDGSRVTLPKFW